MWDQRRLRMSVLTCIIEALEVILQLNSRLILVKRWWTDCEDFTAAAYGQTWVYEWFCRCSARHILFRLHHSKLLCFKWKKKKKREKKQQSNSSSSVLVFERRRLQTGVQVRSECNCVWSHCQRREDVPWWRRQIFKHTCTFSTCAFHTARRERSSEPQVEPQLLSSRSSLGRNLYCCCLIWASFLLASSSSLSFLSISSWAAMIWTDTHVLVQQKITEEINHFRV